jgi:hypothetical protein
MRSMAFGGWGLQVYLIREQEHSIVVLDLTWAK